MENYFLFLTKKQTRIYQGTFNIELTHNGFVLLLITPMSTFFLTIYLHENILLVLHHALLGISIFNIRNLNFTKKISQDLFCFTAVQILQLLCFLQTQRNSSFQIHVHILLGDFSLNIFNDSNVQSNTRCTIMSQ